MLVPKKDGNIRLCINYRQLNAITVNDSYPMPRLEDIICTAKRTPYMSTIDLVWVLTSQHPKGRPLQNVFRDTIWNIPLQSHTIWFKELSSYVYAISAQISAGLGDRAVFAYMADFLVLSDFRKIH